MFFFKGAHIWLKFEKIAIIRSQSASLDIEKDIKKNKPELHYKDDDWVFFNQI